MPFAFGAELVSPYDVLMCLLLSRSAQVGPIGVGALVGLHLCVFIDIR